PNLANIPTYAWQNSLVGGKIFGIPIARAITGNGMLYRDDWMKAAGLSQPKNSDDFFNLMKAFTDAKNQRWGMASSNDSTFNMSFFMQMFNAPNGWRRESNGTLTNQVEAPEFPAAVAFMNKIYAAGYTYPDTANLNIQQAKAFFAAGKFGCYWDGITASPQMWYDFNVADPKATFSLMAPVAANGGKPTYFFSSGYYGYTAVSQKALPRIKEMLNLLDYGSAPLGSDEWRFLSFGIQGRDWNPGPGGIPVQTKTGQADGGNLMNYAGSPPFTFFDSAFSQPTQIEWDFCKACVPLGIYDPTLGLYSATNAAKAASLSKLIADRVIAMVTGRSPLSEVKTLVSDWKSQGGDQIRKEYAAALGT
ncbi:MAG TPA: extracellular solute-binding protein, partial [Chloroflexota bacterium]